MEEYWITRFLFQRALSVIYIAAFSVVVNQFVPLCGTRGLAPSRSVLKAATFRQVPTIFWINSSDRFLLTMGWVGLVLAYFAASGLSEAFGLLVSVLVWFALWAIYLSFVNIGRTFYAFGWESLLLETGFLAIFLGSADTAPSILVIWLLRWLLFRLMFGAGLIKIRGDECWRNLTCMQYHYETQPMPNPLSWFFHRLPVPVHKASVLFNHFVELIVPFAYFFPGKMGALAGIFTIVFQLLLIVSGNFSWLNYLTVVIAISCFDDQTLSLVPLSSPHLSVSLPHQAAVYCLTAMVVLLSIRPVRNLLSSGQLMNTSYDPFHLVNTYGAFGSITKNRQEIVIEGTNSAIPDDSAQWYEYEFKGKPGNVGRTPPLVAPYHYRLDWQMWFAAMGPYWYQSWFPTLLKRLLEGDRQILGLLAANPFPDHPPAFVRAVWYHYRFTDWVEWKSSGAWWKRERLELYFPPATLKTLQGAEEEADAW